MEFDAIGFFIPLAISLAAVAISFVRWRKIDVPGRLLSISILLGTLINLASFLYPAHNNTTFIILHVYALIDFLFLCAFFTLAMPAISRKNVGYYLASGGTLYWIVNLALFRHARHSDTYFVAFQTLVACVLSLYSLYILIRQHDWETLKPYSTFWFVLSMSFFYGLTFTYNISYNVLLKNKNAYIIASDFFMVVCNLYYVSTGLIYLFTDKRNHPKDR